MTRLLSVTALAAAVLLSATGWAGAQPPRRGEQPGRQGIFERFQNLSQLLPPGAEEKLKLTDEQKKKIEQIQKELGGNLKEKADKLRDEAQKAFQDRNREATQRIGEQLRELNQEAEKVRADFDTKVKALLNDEQKKTYEELVRNRVTGIFGGFGRGGFGGQPPFGVFAPARRDLMSRAVQEQLNLTAEQKEKLEKLQKEFEEKSLGVLTDEQKKKYEELKREEPRRRFGGERPNRPNRSDN